MEALVLWEVSKKQHYIFSSNRLKENRGASIIIEDVTESMPLSFPGHYENDLIYNGGGSSLYKFKDMRRADGFIRNISEKALRDYPGIELFMVIQTYDEKKDKITKIIDCAYKKLAIKKNRRENSGGQLSFGIERICESTGLPASHVEIEDGTKRYFSKEVKTKINNSEKNNEKFDYLLPVENSIREFRELSKGEKNYIAVVHIDGNQMGVKLQMLKEGFDYKDVSIQEENERYLIALKKFSNDIKTAYESSFKYMANKILENKDRIKDITMIEEGKFPLIPIIIAGDDITYVTNGKIGIESARLFIEHLNTHSVNINGKDISLNACAGVTIARVGYQFYKAYELAEDLCNNAKRKVLKDYAETGKDYSLIDWHIEQGDVIGGIEEIREKDYISLDGRTLYMRPLYLNNTERWTNYANFRDACHYIAEREIGGQKLARNKLKRLRDVLRKGKKETEVFIRSNNLYYFFPALFGVGNADEVDREYCFFNGTCMYYDTIEAIDLFVELK